MISLFGYDEKILAARFSRVLQSDYGINEIGTRRFRKATPVTITLLNYII